MEPTATFRNKDTGEIRKFTMDQALSRGIPQDKFLEKLKAEGEIKQIAEKGIGDIGTAEQQFKRKQAGRAVDEMERLYGRGSKENVDTNKDLSLSAYSTSPSKVIGKISQIGKSFLDPDFQKDLNNYQNQLKVSIGTLTQAFGSGTPQEHELRILLESAPTATSTGAEAKQWFESVRNLLGVNTAEKSIAEKATASDQGKGVIPTAEAKGISPKEVVAIANKPIEKENIFGKLTQNPIVNFFLGPAIKTAQDIGTGMGLGGKEEQNLEASQNQAIEQANQAFDKANEIEATDPEQAKKLRQVGNDALSQVGFNAQSISKLFSEDIEKPYGQRGLETGINIASTAEIPALIKGGVGLAKGVGGKILGKGAAETTEQVAQKAVTGGLKGKVVQVGEKVESLSPKNILGNAQKKAAELYKGVQPNTDKLIRAGENLAQQDPDIARMFTNQKDFLKKINDIPTLLDRMQFWGRNAYLKGGGIKAAAKAELYDTFYKEGLQQLKDLAPEVYKNRALLRFSFELPKTAAKLLWRATLGRVALGAF